jgi:hypothetical protein
MHAGRAGGEQEKDGGGNRVVNTQVPKETVLAADQLALTAKRNTPPQRRREIFLKNISSGSSLSEYGEKTQRKNFAFSRYGTRRGRKPSTGSRPVG